MSRTGDEWRAAFIYRIWRAVQGAMGTVVRPWAKADAAAKAFFVNLGRSSISGVEEAWKRRKKQMSRSATSPYKEMGLNPRSILGNSGGRR